MSTAGFAVLLSALVAPGAGHFYLKHNGRGAALLASTLIAIATIALEASRQARAVIEKIEAEGGAIDVARITELVNQSLATADTAAVTVASYAIAACWLAGVVDSYRLAKKKH